MGLPTRATAKTKLELATRFDFLTANGGPKSFALQLSSGFPD
jgi:hypothetical protein